jgi:phthiocerol/phenolphthiocerol synthesis type-I polyketide synthase E
MEQELYANDVAIIGMSGRFPGAGTLEEFWQNLSQGVDSITFFTDQQLRDEGISEETLRNPDYVKAGAVLEDIAGFDAAFFDISPHDAALMDPQQRLFLECAWEVLERAGYDTLRCEERIGVFAGAGMNTYLLNNLSQDRALLEREGNFTIGLGNEKEYLATRTSYKLNLNGPSISVSTACSTSLVAVHLAIQSLLSHESDIVLAGAAAIKVPHHVGYWYQEGGIASPDGSCRAFDKTSQGTLRASGAGVVLLKRFNDALRDNDQILAVIKGSAVNNDGSAKIGYTAPSVTGQAAVITEAQEVAGIAPACFDYIEAHGTGTQLGDPIEVRALTQAFRRATQECGYCALGSVKSNVGHLDVVAGIAGLIKVVLALRHRQIPPSLHFSEPNPEIPFATSPFFVNNQLLEWKQNGHPRTAGVSSFGIGGTNAHIVVQESPPLPVAQTAERPYYLLPLSAKSPTALDQMRRNLAAYLVQEQETKLADVAATLQHGRRQFAQRSFVVGRDREELLRQLSAEGTLPKRGNTVRANMPEVAFLFPGQGSQHIHMAAELYQSEPVFRAALERCAEYASPLLKQDIRSIIYPSEQHIERAMAQLTQTAFAQPALFMVEYALAQQWMAWGIIPTALSGHSVGEYVAACLSGVFTLEDALHLIIQRGYLIQGMPTGSMLAVPLGEEEVYGRLSGYPQLSLAAINTPKRCVVAGPHAEIERFSQELHAQGVMSRLLHTSHAFHSTMLEPLVPSFTDAVRKLRRKNPQIPLISNLTGTWFTAEDAANPAYWAKHLCQPVRFSEGVGTLLNRSACILLELGPGTTLSSLVKQHPAYHDGHLMLSSLPHPKSKEGDLATMLRALGQCWSQGREVDWSRFTGEGWQKVALPTYPFERQRHWIDGRQASAEVAAVARKEVFSVSHLPEQATTTESMAISRPTNASSEAMNRRPVAYQDGLTEIFADQLEIMEQQIDTLYQVGSVPVERIRERW